LFMELWCKDSIKLCDNYSLPVHFLCPLQFMLLCLELKQ
jgi:hypothetical protein